MFLALHLPLLEITLSEASSLFRARCLSHNRFVFESTITTTNRGLDSLKPAARLRTLLGLDLAHPIGHNITDILQAIER